MSTNLSISKHDQTAVITIQREKFLNALNFDTLTELKETFVGLADDSSVRSIILTGAGEKAFVAGADIKQFLSFKDDEGEKLASFGHEIMDLIYTFPKLVIAAVNGFALGGGLELAMACHIRVASENAKFGLPEVSLGIIPGYGGTQRLPDLVGRGKAVEMIATGQMIAAEEALQWGLVNYVVPSSQLMEKSFDILSQAHAKSQQAISAALVAVNAGLAFDVDGYEMEIKKFGECFGTADFKEGVDAFLNKRKPNF